MSVFLGPAFFFSVDLSSSLLICKRHQRFYLSNMSYILHLPAYTLSCTFGCTYTVVSAHLHKILSSVSFPRFLAGSFVSLFVQELSYEKSLIASISLCPQLRRTSGVVFLVFLHEHIVACPASPSSPSHLSTHLHPKSGSIFHTNRHDRAEPHGAERSK